MGKQEHTAAREVRLCGGDFRGRKLKGAPGVRPLPAMIRESLFSMLGGQIAGARTLDLYAGTGAVAFEALGRGAREADLAERAHGPLRALRDNIHLLGLEDRARVMEGDVIRLLATGRFAGGGYGFVFIGPPFDRGLCAPTLERITPRELSGAGAVIVVQASPREPLPDRIGCLTRERVKDYRDNLLYFFRPDPGE